MFVRYRELYETFIKPQRPRVGALALWLIEATANPLYSIAADARTTDCHLPTATNAYVQRNEVSQ